ncbi:MAG: hypothetical protein QOJ62_1020 [Actinomycetota bacterium]|nr:hypothetical protein [Actinomycetota bacterium]
MGAWGPGIFADDTASDIRGEYRELLEDQVSDGEATHRVIEAYRHLDADEEHVLWLALAATQSQLGRLDDEVHARALDVIDNGRGLELWEQAGPRELAKRKAALAKLRAQLTRPQPDRKTVRRPWRHETELLPGDILSFTASNGAMALLRVLRVDDHRVGAAPIVEWLDWTGRSLPGSWGLRRLKARGGNLPALGGARRSATYRVARHRKKDQDWHDSGFVLAARVGPRPEDEEAAAWMHLEWRGLSLELERQLAS